MSSSREENVYLANLAEQAERYEEMAEFMEKVVKTIDTEELTVEERNLLFVAYKKVIGPRRVSWRIISYIEQKEESKVIEDHVSIIRGKIETELTKICAGILNLLDSHLIPTASVAQSKAFYLQMKGDFHRYLAEFKTGAERKEAVESTLMAYKSAQDIALADLPPTHPAFDEAISELDTLGEESYIDNAKIMELRDNMTVWTSDMNVHFCSQPDSFICWVENFQDEAGGDEIKEASKHETEETPQ